MSTVGLEITGKDKEAYTYNYYPNFPDKEFVMSDYMETDSDGFADSLYDFTVKIMAEVLKNYKVSDHLLFMNAARDIPNNISVHKHIEDILESETLRASIEGLHFLYQGVGDLYNALQNERETADSQYTFLVNSQDKPLYFPKGDVELLKMEYERNERNDIRYDFA